ncbi:MAG: hypothetical protein EDM03_08620 [Porphyrobacter sp. IPPAS B-1204]|nr:MAG: hypothetical protein EDM03_08620 [Porphyrobacter sp. IPPAS B-1204]
MIGQIVQRPAGNRIASGFAVALVLAGGLGVAAQPAFQSSASLIDGLRGCRNVAGDRERAACYDGAASALIGAVDAGDVRLVDREQVRQTRRQLFGSSAPELDILKSDGKSAEEATDLLETTIVSAVKTGLASWRFTTAEGAVWEINNPPRKIAPIMPGDKVVFKKASLGFFFIRINGQIGVKGRRVS